MAVVILDTGVDRTVRAPTDILSPACWRDDDGGGRVYVGPDHSSREGAQTLANRLREFWLARGEDRRYEIFPAARVFSDKGHFWGVRLAAPGTFASEMQEAA